MDTFFKCIQCNCVYLCFKSKCMKLGFGRTWTLYQCSVTETHTIVALCDGVHGILYTRVRKWQPRRSWGCSKPMDPKSQRAKTVLLYLGNIIIPLLKVLLSSSNINYGEYAKFYSRRTVKQLFKQETILHCSLEPAAVSY